MKTIALHEPGQFSLCDSAEPERREGEALVRVRRVGVCGTDYHAFRGKQPFFSYPRILGHELGVEVLEAPDNPYGIRAGDRCAVEPYLNCGDCVACRKGKTNCCTSLKVLGVHIDGGMRDLLSIPVNKLHQSESLTLEQLALVETIGIGAHAVARAALEPGETVLVIGAGPIGLSAMEMAKGAGARVLALDMNPRRLEFCREAVGVEACVNSAEEPAKAIAELTSGDMPTAVFDCTGNPASMMKAFDYPANGGKLIFVGLFIGDVTFHDPLFHRKEITLLASRNSTRSDMQRVIQALESGKIDSTAWITHRAAAGEMIERFPQWLEPESGVIKAIVDWE